MRVKRYPEGYFRCFRYWSPLSACFSFIPPLLPPDLDPSFLEEGGRNCTVIWRCRTNRLFSRCDRFFSGYIYIFRDDNRVEGKLRRGSIILHYKRETLALFLVLLITFFLSFFFFFFLSYFILIYILCELVSMIDSRLVVVTSGLWCISGSDIYLI